MSAAPVVVIGAGPAGCAAAISLGRLGHEVILLERGLPGKDKPCGDAWLPDALALLTGLGVPNRVLPSSHGRAFARIDLWDAHRPIWSIPLDAPGGWIANRAAVDQALRDVASPLADIRYGTSANGLAPHGSGWEISLSSGATRQSLPAAAVILASGAANALSRKFGISGDPVTGASISVYASMPGLDAPVFQFAPLGIPGYGWVFPLADDRVNVGVCAAVSTPANLRAMTGRYLERWPLEETGSFRAGAGPMWSDTGRRWHHPSGLVSCGDAAGLVDPLTGEGIAPALESGIAAARAIAGFLDGDSRALSGYSTWVAQAFSRRYARTPTRLMWQHLNGATGSPPEREIVHNRPSG